MPLQENKKRKPIVTAFGWALTAIGFLILLPSGLCTAVVGFLTIFNVAADIMGNRRIRPALFEFPSGVIVITAIGAAIAYAGWKLRN